MADRTSAGIFGDLFTMLAENPTPRHREMAMKIFEMSRHYDFTEYQMGADEACITLGVAREGVNPGYPEEGVVTLWPRDKGWAEAAGE
jgi:hypothetical protein